MSYTNKRNIYIPFREDELGQRSHTFNKIKQYYESNGFNIIVLDSGHKIFNPAASKNMAFDNDEDIFCIINSDTLIDVRSLNKSIELCSMYMCNIKPFKRRFLVSNLDECIDIIAKESIIESFNYHSVVHYYSGGAWIIYNKKDKIKKFNEGILDQNINSIDYLIRSSIDSKTIFYQSDCYSLNHAKIDFNKDSFNSNSFFSTLSNYQLPVYKNSPEEDNLLSFDEIKNGFIC
jgi:hypothetical protein